MRKSYKYDKKGIDLENQHDERRIAALHPAISFQKFESDFKKHVKYENNLAKSHKILPPPMRLGQVLDVEIPVYMSPIKSSGELEAEYLSKTRLLTKLERHKTGHKSPCPLPSERLVDEDYDFPYHSQQREEHVIGVVETGHNYAAASPPNIKSADLNSTTGSVQWQPHLTAEFEEQALSSVEHIPIIKETSQVPELDENADDQAQKPDDVDLLADFD